MAYRSWFTHRLQFPSLLLSWVVNVHLSLVGSFLRRFNGYKTPILLSLLDDLQIYFAFVIWCCFKCILLRLSTGLTRAIFSRNSVEVPCPDPAAGLYIRTRSGQIVKVQYWFFLMTLHSFWRVWYLTHFRRIISETQIYSPTNMSYTLSSLHHLCVMINIFQVLLHLHLIRLCMGKMK